MTLNERRNTQVEERTVFTSADFMKAISNATLDKCQQGMSTRT